MQLKIVAVWIVLGFASLVQVAKQPVEVKRGEHEVINYGNFKRFLNHTLNVSQVLASIYVEDCFECAFRCIATLACFSFNIAQVSSINPSNHVCHLLATDKYNHSSNFVPSQEFHHYAIASPCESFPCQNDGKCRTLYKENTYVCDCREGFFGNLCEKECHPVGVSDRNTIPDARMTASSHYDSRYYSHYGRLNEDRGRGWCPSGRSAGTEYLEVDMGKMHSVCAVETQGATGIDEWTTNFRLQFSSDGATWNTYKENNTEKVFPGNKDRNTVVKNTLRATVEARFVRFYFVTYNNWPAIRVEIFVLN